MRIRCGYEINYDVRSPAAPMVLMLSTIPDRAADLETPDEVTVSPVCPRSDYQDMFGNRCVRIHAPNGALTLSSEFVVHDSGLHDDIATDALQHEIEDLPPEVLVYLLGSRYCETDRLSDLAWSIFGREPKGWGLVQSIVSYTHERISFGYEHARATKTAFEAHQERRGVCRDFAHLAVTLCRCMNIPARYATGYLGDIGVPPVDDPMDFSAWFEVYLGGRWYTFDARHNTPRIGRVVMARGRDATDVAIVTSFGNCVLTGFKVITDELPG